MLSVQDDLAPASGIVIGVSIGHLHYLAFCVMSLSECCACGRRVGAARVALCARESTWLEKAKWGKGSSG